MLAQAEVVFKYLLKIGARKEDAEDIVQETIVTTMECLTTIQPEYLRAWLFKVALNRYYTLYNKQQRMTYWGEEELERVSSALADGEQSYLQKEHNERLYETLQGLQPMFQQLLLMKYDMEFSYKEIATVLAVSEAHVKTYLQRARATFKKRWEETEHGSSF
ncbi:DNA-directed RNA polymerase sigma-70 factor [Lysinibacillus piscis]|uniref:RNA polymerase sigma factor n=1 Tax=Lysinibacillus piscis TaxID=2518931 RepID=A0ABQ5NPN4_9BACI|nr:DNA-directed RNA polymerase sigma-70 factor [Lysinibacillus sp. KH24]